MDYKNLITTKFAVRDYKEKEVDQKTMKAIQEYARKGERLIPDIEVDIRFMGEKEVYTQLDGFAGYQGNLIKGPHYMIVLSEKKEYAVENGGYIGEEVSLKAHELGVDSCWITFSDSKTVIEKLNIVTDKEVVALLVLGYGKGKAQKTILGKVKTGGNYTKADMSVKSSYSNKSLPIEEMVYMGEWEKKATVDELLDRALYEPLSCATMAPSTLSRQPWRFIIDGGKVILALRKEEGIQPYEEKIDAGIVMLYFEVVVEQTLCKMKWQLGSVENQYGVPEEYEIVAVCNM